MEYIFIFIFGIFKLLVFGGILFYIIVNYDKYDVVKWFKLKVVK